MSAASEFDSGPLSWVKGEVDLALNQAGAALAAYRPGGDTTPLRQARTHLHQAHGALAMIGIDGPTQVGESLETLLRAMEDGLLDAEKQPSALSTAEAARLAIQRYLDDLMAGAPHQPLRLQAVYLALGGERGVAAHAADLFVPDLECRPPRRDAAPAADAETLAARLKSARLHYQKALLIWLKKPELAEQARGQLRGALAEIEALQDTPAARSFWWSALAFCDALADPVLAADPRARQLCSNVDGQIRRLLEGQGAVPERLARDVLYFVALAGPEAGEQVAAVRACFELDALLPAAAAEVLPDNPVVRRLREATGAADNLWNKFCAGSGTALASLAEQAGQCAALTAELGQTDLKRLAQGLSALAHWLAEDAARRQPPVVRELGTALRLLGDAAAHYPDFGAAFAAQVDVTVERLHAAMAGRPLGQNLPALEDLGRQAEEKLFVGQAARDILAQLTLVEQALDAYFRSPAQGLDAAAVEAPLKEVAAKLAMLGHLPAVGTVKACIAGIQALAAGEQPPPAEACEALARQLSELGFFAEALPEGATDFTRFVQRWEAPAEAVAPAPEPAPPVEDDEFAERPAEPAAVPPPSAATLELAEAGHDAIDAELLAIFLEEARDVLATLAEQLAALHAAPYDSAALTTIRRATHTLKGSGRMVGLRDLGEAAWELEQTYNLWLREERALTSEVFRLIEDEHALFSAWVEQLAAGSGPAPDPRPLVALAVRLREEGRGDPQLSATAAALAELLSPVERALAEKAPSERSTVKTAPISPAPAAASASAPTPAPEAAPVPNRLHEIFREEARGHLATLQAEMRGLDAEPAAPAPFEMTRAAHTLGGIAATVGLLPLNRLSIALENALLRRNASPQPAQASALSVVREAIGVLQAMYDGLPSGLQPAEQPELLAALAGCYADLAVPSLDEAMALADAAEAEADDSEIPTLTEQALEEMQADAPAELLTVEAIETLPAANDDELPAAVADELSAATPEAPARHFAAAAGPADEIDEQLLPLFLDEAGEQLPALGELARQWRQQPDDAELPRAVARLLHTFKGNARMAGAMALGEVTHQLETHVAGARQPADPALIDELEAGLDTLAHGVDALRQPAAAVPEAAPAEAVAAPAEIAIATAPAEAASALPAEAPGEAQQSTLRVRADLLDRLVNEAGEVSIARSRVEGELRSAKRSLGDLTENIARLREQLREIEIQAEARIQSRVGHASGAAAEFDPLELDRYTRFQELTRFMAESVNDVATVQQNLLRHLDEVNGTLIAQGRLNRSLQQGLMSVRMLPFASLADRLYRVVRQTAKTADKRANLEIVGDKVEVDRSILDQMLAPLEHMLRNAVAHGIEAREARLAAGKPESGEIVLRVAQEGNEIVLTLADDGRGLDRTAIRSRAEAQGLLAADAEATPDELYDFIFRPGFSTAGALTQDSGRGVGMDVVKTAVVAVGGRIEVHSEAGRGTTFRLSLPATLAVMQSALVDVGGRVYAIPATMVEQVQELRDRPLAELRARGAMDWRDHRYPFHTLSRLLDLPDSPADPQRASWVLLLRSGNQRLAVLVDDMAGSQEVVVKNVGAQLSRMPGIDGATVLGDGRIVLILNPVALAQREAVPRPAAAGEAGPAAADGLRLPVVLVVDDSLTVRKITSRLLEREGYQVVLAKDGVDALEQLVGLQPDAILSDIEMPRMDGFDLLRNLRADAKTRSVPVIMITSRTAEKHKNHALSLGADHYLGKPYDEGELLALLAAACGRPAPG